MWVLQGVPPPSVEELLHKLCALTETQLQSSQQDINNNVCVQIWTKHQRSSCAPVERPDTSMRHPSLPVFIVKSGLCIQLFLMHPQNPLFKSWGEKKMTLCVIWRAAEASNWICQLRWVQRSVNYSDINEIKSPAESRVPVTQCTATLSCTCVER